MDPAWRRWRRSLVWQRWRTQPIPNATTSGPTAFEEVLEQAPVMALLVDEQQRVLAANVMARKFFSIAPERLPASLVEATRESRLRDAFQPGRPRHEINLAHHQRRVQSLVLPAPGAGQSLLYLTDVTELRRLENVRQEFVANLSHELKTPITSLRLAVESLLGDPPPSSRRRFAERALRETDHLAAIIANLRQLAEIEAGRVLIKTSRFELAPLLLETAQRLHVDRPLNLSMPPGLSLVGDRAKLAQALGNLFDNAAKFSPPESPIDIEAGTGPGEIVIRVRDRGTGISPEHWDRVFERFYKVDPARTREIAGSGLGLAITKHLVQLQGGRVWTYASPDGGQVFALALPDHSGGKTFITSS